MNKDADEYLPEPSVEEPNLRRMSESATACPTCGKEGKPIGQLQERQHFRCPCGSSYSRPVKASIAESGVSPVSMRRRYRTLSQYRAELEQAGVPSVVRGGKLCGDVAGSAFEIYFSDMAHGREYFQWPVLRIGNKTYADVAHVKAAGKISDGLAQLKHLAGGSDVPTAGDVVEKLLSPKMASACRFVTRDELRKLGKAASAHK